MCKFWKVSLYQTATKIRPNVTICPFLYIFLLPSLMFYPFHLSSYSQARERSLTFLTLIKFSPPSILRVSSHDDARGKTKNKRKTPEVSHTHTLTGPWVIRVASLCSLQEVRYSLTRFLADRRIGERGIDLKYFPRRDESGRYGGYMRMSGRNVSVWLVRLY